MKMQTVERGDVTVVRLEGRLDTTTVGNAQPLLDEVLEKGALKILFDLEGLDYVSSAGLRILLSTAMKLRARGGELRFCQLTPSVLRVFEISGFNTIFELFPSEEEALVQF